MPCLLFVGVDSHLDSRLEGDVVAHSCLCEAHVGPTCVDRLQLSTWVDCIGCEVTVHLTGLDEYLQWHSCS